MNARVIEIWHASKIRIQSGSKRLFIHILKDSPEEAARFSGHGGCVLSPGIAVTFDQDDTGQITNVKFDIETPEFPEYEDSTIIEWHPSTRVGGCGYGFAERGCSLGCRDDDVITQGVPKVGTWINHAVSEQSDGRIKAAKISIYKEAKREK